MTQPLCRPFGFYFFFWLFWFFSMLFWFSLVLDWFWIGFGSYVGILGGPGTSLDLAGAHCEVLLSIFFKNRCPCETCPPLLIRYPGM